MSNEHNKRIEYIDYIDCIELERCENGSWFNHVLEWWEAANADPEHVLFLHYEAMLSEPAAHIKKIAEFAGIEHTDEVIAKVKKLETSRWPSAG